MFRGKLTDKMKTAMKKGREESKKNRDMNYVFLNLGNIRIVRFDEWNLRVDLKKGNTWQEKGFFSTPEGAIRKAIRLPIDINHKLALEGLLELFEHTVKRMLELAQIQAKKWQEDTDREHERISGEE
jgi:hypothetical protein